MKGDDGLEFVEFAEGPTKTRHGGLNAKSRQFQPKMFQTGRERCTVALFREYISRRLPNPRTSGPFYLSIKYNRGSRKKKPPLSHLRSCFPITVPAKHLPR